MNSELHVLHALSVPAAANVDDLPVLTCMKRAIQRNRFFQYIRGRIPRGDQRGRDFLKRLGLLLRLFARDFMPPDERTDRVR